LKTSGGYGQDDQNRKESTRNPAYSVLKEPHCAQMVFSLIIPGAQARLLQGDFFNQWNIDNFSRI
jgi:hypothetical protein